MISAYQIVKSFKTLIQNNSNYKVCRRTIVDVSSSVSLMQSHTQVLKHQKNFAIIKIPSFHMFIKHYYFAPLTSVMYDTLRTKFDKA